MLDVPIYLLKASFNNHVSSIYLHRMKLQKLKGVWLKFQSLHFVVLFYPKIIFQRHYHPI